MVDKKFEDCEKHLMKKSLEERILAQMSSPLPDGCRLDGRDLYMTIRNRSMNAANQYASYLVARFYICDEEIVALGKPITMLDRIKDDFRVFYSVVSDGDVASELIWLDPNRLQTFLTDSGARVPEIVRNAAENKMPQEAFCLSWGCTKQVIPDHYGYYVSGISATDLCDLRDRKGRIMATGPKNAFFESSEDLAMLTLKQSDPLMTWKVERDVL